MDYFKKLKAKARTGLHRDRTKSTASLSTINSDLVAGSSTAPAESETPPPTPEITAEITPVSTAPCDALPLPFTEPETPPPQPVQERTPVLTTAKNAVEAILYVVAESADAFAPLKSVLGGLRAILDLKEKYSGNKEKVATVIQRLEDLESLVSENTTDTSEIERRKKLAKKFNSILVELDRILGQNMAERLANAVPDESTISSRVEDIRDALLDYQVSLQQQLLQIALGSIAEADWAKLDKMSRAREAEYSSEHHQKCLKGTREQVLQDIEAWAADSRDERVYWLNGHAGSGKSTIAQTFAENSFAAGRLGASFFCSRDTPERSNLKLIFPTIAFQLARQSDSFRHHLLKNVSILSVITEGSLANQLQELLIKPLKASGISTLIIIDALDECKDENSRSVILSLLGRYIEEIPLVKFFITGRPEPRIQSGFQLPLLRPYTEVLLLHEVEPTSVNKDIRTYLTFQLSELAKSRDGLGLSAPWPSIQDLDALVHKAGGFFIFASTACKFIAAEPGYPPSLLRLIVDLPGKSSYEGLFGLDRLYTTILNENYILVNPKPPGMMETTRAILGVVVLAYNPMSRAMLAAWLNTTPFELMTFLRPLHSLVRVPSSELDPITVYHKSFPDYITDLARCSNPEVFGDPSVHHSKLAIRCLELMVARLKRNPCNLPQYEMNADVSDLRERRKEFLGDDLEYACRFWANHLACSSTATEYVQQILLLLRTLFERKLLAWLEVLSLMGEARAAVESLLAVKSWLLAVGNLDPHLLELVIDSDRAVRHIFDVIRESASHIYESGLHWLPLTSLVRLQYSNQTVDRFTLTNAVRRSWDSCLMRFKPGNNVYSVAYSRRGHLLALCGSNNNLQNNMQFKGFLRLYDAETGVCIANLTRKEGDLWLKQGIGRVQSVAFSPDDMLLASASGDSTITIWDVKTGNEVKTLEGHTDVVKTVHFSPNGLQLASGSWDHSIRIWDVASGGCQQILTGHSNRVRSVGWSPSGDLLLSGGDDKTSRLWEVSTGTCRREFKNHTRGVSCVSVSPDDSKMATSSFDKTIHLYDTTTCHHIRTISEDSSVWCLCFYPDGKKLLCGTDIAVSVWDLAQGVKLSSFRSDPVISLSLSLDTSRVASALNIGGYAIVWQLETTQTSDASLKEHDHHSNRIQNTCFAPNGKTIATASSDRSVKLWDADSGTCLHTFGLHPAEAYRVTFSSDSSHLASGFKDKSIVVWDAKSHAVIATLEQSNITATALRYSPNDSQLISVSYDGTMTVWGTDRWEKRLELDITEKGFVMSATEAGDLVVGPLNKPCKAPLRNLPDFVKWPVMPFSYSALNSWVTDRQRKHVLWIPADFRGESDFYGAKLALGSRSGKVVIVDFLTT